MRSYTDQPLTLEELRQCPMQDRGHLDGQDKNGKWFADVVQVAEHPRLQAMTKQWRKRGVHPVTTWWLDGEPIGTIEEAIAALNAAPLPVIDAGERGALNEIKDEWEEHPESPPRVVLSLMDKGLVEVRRERDSEEGKFKVREYRRTELGRAVL